MRRKIHICFLLCVSLISALAQAQTEPPNREQSPYQCHVVHLPTSWAFDNPPGIIESSNAWFSDIGWATLDLRFRNGEATAIQALALVVESIDAEEEVIDRVPMVSHVDPSVAKIPPNVLKPADAWGSPLSRGDAELMTGDTFGIRTGRCPVRARVTFARVHFTDGSVRTYSSPEWRLGPSPALVPTLPEATPDLPVEPPVSLLAKLKISASGRVLDVVPEESADPRLVEWIRGRMKPDWKFYPAFLNGKPTDSELNVLFLIHAKGMIKFAENRPVLQPVTLIQFIWSRDLYPQTGEADKLTVMYGFLREGSAPNLPFQEFVSRLCTH
jgi:hypothetical protein